MAFNWIWSMKQNIIIISFKFTVDTRSAFLWIMNREHKVFFTTSALFIWNWSSVCRSKMSILSFDFFSPVITSSIEYKQDESKSNVVYSLQTCIPFKIQYIKTFHACDLLGNIIILRKCELQHFSNADVLSLIFWQSLYLRMVYREKSICLTYL